MSTTKKTILVSALFICGICMTIASVVMFNELIQVGFRQLVAEDKIMVFTYPMMTISTVCCIVNIVKKCN